MPRIAKIPIPHVHNGSRVPASQQPSQECLLGAMHKLLVIHDGYPT
jgi:hypothetical protein